MILLLSYDLNKYETSDEYRGLIDSIEKYAGSGNYIRVLKSQWFVDTDLSIGQWDQIMSDATDENDTWMIIHLTRRPTGRYSADAIQWVNARLSTF